VEGTELAEELEILRDMFPEDVNSCLFVMYIFNKMQQDTFKCDQLFEVYIESRMSDWTHKNCN
jgi:hypothetical protein